MVARPLIPANAMSAIRNFTNTNAQRLSFADAEAYLSSTLNEQVSSNRPYRLDRMRALLRELGDPQTMYPTVHVGGTSGKGSTATMIASCLQTSGKRTGLHTKPHLSSVTERACIDSTPIAEQRFADLLAMMLPAIEAVSVDHGRPSYYETTLALAFLHFSQEHVGIAVIEAGLGGELDGTNVLRPRVAVLTNVSLDHTDVLGTTIEEIARDEAGIAKSGVPLVTDAHDSVAREIIEAQCRAVGAPFFSVAESNELLVRAADSAGQRFNVTTARERYAISLQVLGEFQQQNARTAICALEQLDAEFRPSHAQIEEGLHRFTMPGRMELFPGHPPVVFDIAHNEDKAAHLIRALQSTFPGQSVTVVCAIGTSKDASRVLSALAQLPARFIFTTFSVAGREPTSASQLVVLGQAVGIEGESMHDPVAAFALALERSNDDDLIVVTGSTFVVAQLRPWWIAQRRKNEGGPSVAGRHAYTCDVPGLPCEDCGAPSEAARAVVYACAWCDAVDERDRPDARTSVGPGECNRCNP